MTEAFEGLNVKEAPFFPDVFSRDLEGKTECSQIAFEVMLHIEETRRSIKPSFSTSDQATPPSPDHERVSSGFSIPRFPVNRIAREAWRVLELAHRRCPGGQKIRAIRFHSGRRPSSSSAKRRMASMACCRLAF